MSTQALNLPLKGKIAIITGSSRDVGVGIALGAQQTMCRCVITYTSPGSSSFVHKLETKLESLPHKLESLGM